MIDPRYRSAKMASFLRAYAFYSSLMWRYEYAKAAEDGKPKEQKDFPKDGESKPHV